MRLFLAPFIHMFVTAFFLCTKTMGIMLNGILGTTTGKIGGVVGSTWRGRNTVRAYAKPGNPNTAAQQIQRGLFSFVLLWASKLLGSVINVYWDPFASTISGFNKFVKTNLLAISSNSDFNNLVIATGSLEPIIVDGITYTTGTGAVGVDFSSHAEAGNGEDTDLVKCVILDTDNDIAFSLGTVETRGDDNISGNIGAGRTAANLKAYVFCTRGTGNNMIVSPSVFVQPAA